MKKMWLLSPFLLTLLSVPLFGQEMTNSMDKSEIAKGSILGHNQKSMQRKSNQCTTCCSPDMNYRLEKDFKGTSPFIEYLYWQPQELASDFVITPNSDSKVDPNYNYTQGLGTIQSASFDWNSGVRVGLGYTMSHDYWEALGQYTWYKTSGHSEYSVDGISASSTEFLMPTFYSQSDTGVTSASNDVQFVYQMADFSMIKRFYPTNQIQMNLSLGATGGYIREDFSVTYANVNNTYVVNHWKFGNGGFRAGIESNWHVGYGFGIFGKFSFAALLGQYSVDSRITADGPSANMGTSKYLQNFNLQEILLVPATTMALGIDWCRSFKNCWCSAVTTSITGEFNSLTNLQQIYKSPQDPNYSGYSVNTLFRNFSEVYLYGFNIRLAADF